MHITWYECEIPEEEVVDGDALADIQEVFEDLIEDLPEGAAIFTDADLSSENVRFWLTDVAAAILEEEGFEWRRYYIKELKQPPFKKDAALLIGDTSAWDLLRDDV